jgi:hypothetical protein
MIQFDQNRYIKPYTITEVTIEEFERVLVKNSIRKVLFKSYLQYIESLHKVLDAPFEQWVNGSFASLKPLPFDIDVVTFMEYETFFSKRDVLNNLNKSFPKIDAYYSEVYPIGHKNETLNQINRWQWEDVYGKDRLGRKKGFLKLIFI